MFGLLNVNKPSGITSRRVVDRAQRLVRPHKVGHAGTLDPLASGVLVLAIGQATRLVEYVQQMPKRYRATFLLGRSSTTEDIDGEVTELLNPTMPSLADLEQAARQLVGDVSQRPPDYSALKISGQRAYKLARAGQDVELSPRTIHVSSLQITHYEYPELCMDIECGGGTYVRSLGRDLAEGAGTAAVMSALVRQAIGHFRLEDAVDVESLAAERLAAPLLSPLQAVQGVMPLVTVSPDDIRRLSHGLSIALSSDESPLAAVDGAGQLVAILARKADGSFGPTKFLAAQPS